MDSEHKTSASSDSPLQSTASSRQRNQFSIDYILSANPAAALAAQQHHQDQHTMAFVDQLTLMNQQRAHLVAAAAAAAATTSAAMSPASLGRPGAAAAHDEVYGALKLDELQRQQLAMQLQMHHQRANNNTKAATIVDQQQQQASNPNFLYFMACMLLQQQQQQQALANQQQFTNSLLQQPLIGGAPAGVSPTRESLALLAQLSAGSGPNALSLEQPAPFGSNPLATANNSFSHLTKPMRHPANPYAQLVQQQQQQQPNPNQKRTSYSPLLSSLASSHLNSQSLSAGPVHHQHNNQNHQSHRGINSISAAGHQQKSTSSDIRPTAQSRKESHQQQHYQSMSNSNGLSHRNKQTNSTGSVSPNDTKTTPAAASDDNQFTSSAALSSLSNFVTNSMLDNDISVNRQARPSRRFSSSSSTTSNNQQKLNDSSTSSQRNNTSGRLSLTSASTHNDTSSRQLEDAHDKSGHPQSPGSILGAVANALKGNQPAATTTATTINTTLAKAPPELVQKQPAWVFCTRYSDRPSSGPRTRRAKSKDKKTKDPKASLDEKRPRTAFTSEQLEKLRLEFQANSYLDEKRRKDLAERLCLNENQIKIWFQNKRAKIKKQSNQPNPLRGLLVAGGLYNHSTATSDCSESYVNGLDHDVGNQALGDVDYGEGGGVGGDDDGDDYNRQESNTDCSGLRERNPSSNVRKSSTSINNNNNNNSGSNTNKRRRLSDDDACGNNNNDDFDVDENSNHHDANDGDHDYNDDLVGLKQRQHAKRARLDRISSSDLGDGDDERVISVN